MFYFTSTFQSQLLNSMISDLCNISVDGRCSPSLGVDLVVPTLTSCNFLPLQPNLYSGKLPFCVCIVPTHLQCIVILQMLKFQMKNSDIFLISAYMPMIYTGLTCEIYYWSGVVYCVFFLQIICFSAPFMCDADPDQK